jgi:hypothetical protein
MLDADSLEFHQLQVRFPSGLSGDGRASEHPNPDFIEPDSRPYARGPGRLLKLQRFHKSPEHRLHIVAVQQAVDRAATRPHNLARDANHPGIESSGYRIIRVSNHPGIESAIGALQSGNALERCRDRFEIGFERYMALAVLGRNLHTLGRLLIAKQNEKCEAVFSRRTAA